MRTVLLVLACALAMSFPLATAQAAQPTNADWKTAMVGWCNEHYWDGEVIGNYPFPVGFCPHNNRWGKPAQKVCRWMQDHLYLEETGMLTTPGTKRALWPYLER